MNRLLLPTWTLWLRELTRFYRQRSRVIGSLATPVVFWLFLGSGFGSSFRAADAPSGVGYLEYFFPGSLALILLFTSIFSTISIIEDRREGFLQSVLVAPISPLAIVLGKVLGGASIALIQGTVFLALAPLLGVSFDLLHGLVAMGVMFVIAIGLTGLGFAFAWRTESVQGFHAVMNLVLMPMWFLSGAAFPASGAPTWMRGLMAANPLTYGLAALRRSLYPVWPASVDMPAIGPALAVLVSFAVIVVLWSARAVSPPRTRPSTRRPATTGGRALAPMLGFVAAVLTAAAVWFGMWHWLYGRSVGTDLGLEVPEFSLVRQDESALARSQLRGRVWVANFVFTHCSGPCQAMSEAMSRLQQALPDRVRLVSFSVDPERDTPAELTRYGKQFDADFARWTFLTGTRAQVRSTIIDGFKLPVLDSSGDPENAILHSEKFVLVDMGGRIRGYYDGLADEGFARLVEDASALARVSRLPAINATLNAITTLLLLLGWWHIRRGRRRAHVACMLGACCLSMLFLAGYLSYHHVAGSTPFSGQGVWRPIYFTILISHTILAAAIVPLILTTLAFAARGRFDRHRAIARWTAPMWLYVSVTGVLVYFMLHQWFAPAGA